MLSAVGVVPEVDYLGAAVASPGWAQDEPPALGVHAWRQTALLTMRRGTWGRCLRKVTERATIAGATRLSPRHEGYALEHVYRVVRALLRADRRH